MKLRRNAFYTFATLFFLFCAFFALACTLQRLGEGQEYPYFIKGAWLLGALAFLCILILCAVLWARLDLSRLLRERRALSAVLEGGLVLAMLAAGFVLRYRYIGSMPMKPNSDYKTYYEIAELLRRGRLLEEGVGYCDYIAMFHHVFGYPAVLAQVFRIVGISVSTALYFNLILELAGCAVVWRIARLISGRAGGLTALLAAVFWPSCILYSNFVASEPLFTFLLLAGIWLFTMSLRDTERKRAHPWLCAFQLAGAGLVLAFASFVRPMAIIFLVAAVICMLPGRQSLPVKPRNELTLGLRAMDKGWKRCLLLIAVYLLFSWLFSLGAAYASDRELAGGSASFGYNLLVGLNLESYGGWNQEDSEYLYAALENTGSAQEAQMTSLDMALQRLRVDPKALLDLFVHKFVVLWGNDDYGASWNILFMDQQNNLTPQRESLLYRMMDVSDLYYMLILLLALIAALRMLRREPDASYACVLLFCGTVALHLLVENQNRYHYHTLPLLAILSGSAIRAMMDVCYETYMSWILDRQRLREEKALASLKLRRELEEEQKLQSLRAEALHAQFDMGTAIREGHIRVVVGSDAAEEAVPGGEEEKREGEKADAV